MIRTLIILLMMLFTFTIQAAESEDQTVESRDEYEYFVVIGNLVGALNDIDRIKTVLQDNLNLIPDFVSIEHNQATVWFQSEDDVNILASEGFRYRGLNYPIEAYIRKKYIPKNEVLCIKIKDGSLDRRLLLMVLSLSLDVKDCQIVEQENGINDLVVELQNNRRNYEYVQQLQKIKCMGKIYDVERIDPRGSPHSI